MRKIYLINPRTRGLDILARDLVAPIGERIRDLGLSEKQGSLPESKYRKPFLFAPPPEIAASFN